MRHSAGTYVKAVTSDQRGSLQTPSPRSYGQIPATHQMEAEVRTTEEDAAPIRNWFLAIAREILNSE